MLWVLISCFSSTAFDKGWHLLLLQVQWVCRCSPHQVLASSAAAHPGTCDVVWSPRRQQQQCSQPFHSHWYLPVWRPSWQPKSLPGARRSPVISVFPWITCTGMYLGGGSLQRRMFEENNDAAAACQARENWQLLLRYWMFQQLLSWGTCTLLFLRLHALHSLVFPRSRGKVQLAARKLYPVLPARPRPLPQCSVCPALQQHVHSKPSAELQRVEQQHYSTSSSWAQGNKINHQLHMWPLQGWSQVFWYLCRPLNLIAMAWTVSSPGFYTCGSGEYR